MLSVRKGLFLSPREVERDEYDTELSQSSAGGITNRHALCALFHEKLEKQQRLVHSAVQCGVPSPCGLQRGARKRGEWGRRGVLGNNRKHFGFGLRNCSSLRRKVYDRCPLTREGGATRKAGTSATRRAGTFCWGESNPGLPPARRRPMLFGTAVGRQQTICFGRLGWTERFWCKAKLRGGILACTLSTLQAKNGFCDSECAGKEKKWKRSDIDTMVARNRAPHRHLMPGRNSLRHSTRG